MGFVVDHAVAIAAVIWGAAILVGLIVLVVTGVRLFRIARASRRRIAPRAEALTAAASQTQARMDDLGRHSEDLARATEELSMHVDVLGEIGRAGIEIVLAIRSPLRLLGR